MQANIVDIWRYKDIDVYYSPDVDGDGRNQAPSFVAYIRQRFGTEKRFGRVFEWCAGPAFIGFSLLAEGIAETLCVADVNPTAIDFVRRTVEAAGLSDRVSSYISDNMLDVPESEVFDLVVGNPPTFYDINPLHHDYHWLAGDLRANDPGWKIHEAFYLQIGRHLRPGAPLLIQEVEPTECLVRVPAGYPIHWDTRPEPPIDRFKAMIAAGGLIYEDARKYHIAPRDKVEHWIVASRASSEPVG
ncbi:hypothetical protein BH10PSE14_BH10PSE14_28750 [soil metagenome]